MRHTVYLTFLIVLVGILMIGCEKEAEIIPTQEASTLVDFSQYVDLSFYKKNELKAANVNDGNQTDDCGLYYLPYRFVWQEETTIILDDVCTCLPTTCGNCFPEVVIRVKKTKNETNCYDIFKSYNGDFVSYFLNENWEALLPMLKQNTIDLIINGNLTLNHEYGNESKIAYFNFLDPNDDTNNIFTIQLKIEQ